MRRESCVAWSGEGRSGCVRYLHDLVQFLSLKMRTQLTLQLQVAVKDVVLATSQQVESY